MISCDGEAMGTESPPLREMKVLRCVADHVEQHLDRVAVEAPIALVFNGVSHAVMMATPTDLDALGVGFALSEGIIDRRDECYGIDVRSHRLGFEVEIEIGARALARLKQCRRAMEGRTGCGLCGIESLEQLELLPAEGSRIGPGGRPSPAAILRAFARFPVRQLLNAETGAVHGAGWATLDGSLLEVAEDVGRHNALDKLLGRRALAHAVQEAGFVIVSSRASYELVRKCARLGIATLAAISAPTSLAIEVAERAGVDLYGFCRGDRVVRYAPPADESVPVR